MRRPVSTWRIVLVCLLVATTGCVPTQPFYLHEDGDLSHYIDKATHVEAPDLHTEILQDVAQSQRPLSVLHPEFKDFWDLSLEECVAIALLNSKTIRGGQAARLQNGQIFAGTQEGVLVLNSVGRFVTAYDPAVVESNPGQQVGGLSNFLSNQSANGGGAFNGPTTDGGLANVRQGVEAALAQFDTQLSITSDPGTGIMSVQDRPQNVARTASFAFFPNPLLQHLGGMDIALSKRTAEGTLFSITSSTDYVEGNTRGFVFGTPPGPLQPRQPFLHTWTQVLQMEARHPLLRGRGSQINRMPIILARIGTDIELTNVYANVQDMLNNLEIRYWDLYLAFRNLETAKVARDSALVTWRIVYDKFGQGVEPVQAEAQAQEQYYNFRGSVEAALRTLYDTENELRFLMGLAATDGRLIRPKDDPTLARVEFEWTEILAEAIARRPELVIRRWQVKQRELELILARNLLLPQFDVGAQYRWLGVGQDLIHAGRGPLPDPGSATAGTAAVPIAASAWQSLTGGDFQEFSVLFQYQMPIGFRRELAAVRHAQLRLAREKAILEDSELDVSHGLAHALRNVETNFQLAQTNSNRWSASQNEVKAREELYRGGRVALDDVLEAQRRRAVAQGAFWSSVIEYNKSIADLHTRKGSIMDYDGIGFAEGPWPKKAYWDALARARERDAGWYIDYGWTRPKVISRGPIPQGITPTSPTDLSPSVTTEEVTSPEPTPAQPPAAGSESNPLPAPPSRPQETQSQPRPSLSRATVSSEASGEMDVQPKAMPFGLRYTRSQPVVRAAYWSDAAMGDSNPLRGSSRPVGTGVAEGTTP